MIADELTPIEGSCSYSALPRSYAANADPPNQPGISSHQERGCKASYFLNLNREMVLLCRAPVEIRSFCKYYHGFWDLTATTRH